VIRPSIRAKAIAGIALTMLAIVGFAGLVATHLILALILFGIGMLYLTYKLWMEALR
jgi:arginine exporter protein ArgO